ncbi:threonine/serine exporter family protein [Paenibacillus chungangensis]|uniref:Threonine/serine exporter family protein n=1 Tax=Paenibacillus chungangensis TaxID=696535 RepID=A0ABW3HQC6_9BACL
MNQTIPYRVEDVTEICLLAGKIMLQSGGETYRVEDTMMRIAEAFGIPESQSFVMPTGIIFGIQGAYPATRLVRITDRTTDLQKVTQVNDLSRQIASGNISLDEALEALKGIDEAKSAYPAWVQIAAAAVASGCFMIMFQGVWADFIPVSIAGGIGLALLIWLHLIIPIRFFAEFLASMAIGTVSVLMVKLGFGHHLDLMIIGSVMPLVPGLLLTNAVRDLMAGHLLSGLSKGADAFLTAAAIGAGIAVVLSVFQL